MTILKQSKPYSHPPLTLVALKGTTNHPAVLSNSAVARIPRGDA